MSFEVVVGNVGTVLITDDLGEAVKAARHYMATAGRTSRADPHVVVYKDGHPQIEYGEPLSEDAPESAKFLIECEPQNAAKFMGWLDSRGGLAVWHSVSLSNPGASWTTPNLDEHGEPTEKPTWQANNYPSAIVVAPDRVGVMLPKEVKSFRIGIKRGSGLSMTLTDASSNRLKREMSKIEQETKKDPFYKFDFNEKDQRIVRIFIPDAVKPLPEWLAMKREST